MKKSKKRKVEALFYIKRFCILLEVHFGDSKSYRLSKSSNIKLPQPSTDNLISIIQRLHLKNCLYLYYCSWYHYHFLVYFRDYFQI